MWFKIRAVWARELLDTVRDKRTLYMMVLLPIVIMPLIMMVGPVVMVRQQEAMQEETGGHRFRPAALPLGSAGELSWRGDDGRVSVPGSPARKRRSGTMRGPPWKLACGNGDIAPDRVSG